MNTIYTLSALDKNRRQLQTGSVQTSGNEYTAVSIFKNMLTDATLALTESVECDESFVPTFDPNACVHSRLIMVREDRHKWAETCVNCGVREPFGNLIAPTITPVPEVQPDPIPNSHPAAWSLVIADMAARDIEGTAKYKTRLQPHNGRDTLLDAYQEALDLAVYLRTALYERDGK